jgi:NADH-quinone oxidoreductase subunit N
MAVFLCLELFSICIFIFVLIPRDVFSIDAIVKYFTIGAIASVCIVYGISIMQTHVMLTTGLESTLSFYELYKIFNNNIYDFNTNTMLLVVFFIIFGVSFKIGLYPNYMVIPDLYEGSWFPSTSFIATIPKLIYFTILVKILKVVFSNYSVYWSPMLIFIGFMSVCVGCYAAYNQKLIKRLLGYASVNQLGFVLIATGLDNQLGFGLVFNFLYVYVISSVGLYCILLNLSRKNTNLNNSTKYGVTYLRDLSSLFVNNPKIALFLITMLFSSSGIPPLPGFYIKVMLI